MQKPSKDSAIMSLILGLLCAIPWLNWGTSLLAMFFGFRTIYLIRKYPDRYMGLEFAITGALLGIVALLYNLLRFFFPEWFTGPIYLITWALLGIIAGLYTFFRVLSA